MLSLLLSILTGGRDVTSYGWFAVLFGVAAVICLFLGVAWGDGTILTIGLGAAAFGGILVIAAPLRRSSSNARGRLGRRR